MLKEIIEKWMFQFLTNFINEVLNYHTKREKIIIFNCLLNLTHIKIIRAEGIIVIWNSFSSGVWSVAPTISPWSIGGDVENTFVSNIFCTAKLCIIFESHGKTNSNRIFDVSMKNSRSDSVINYLFASKHQ